MQVKEKKQKTLSHGSQLDLLALTVFRLPRVFLSPKCRGYVVDVAPGFWHPKCGCSNGLDQLQNQDKKERSQKLEVKGEISDGVGSLGDRYYEINKIRRWVLIV